MGKKFLMQGRVSAWLSAFGFQTSRQHVDISRSVGHPIHMYWILVLALIAAFPAFAADTSISRRSPVVEAVERVGPAVVNVSTEQVLEMNRGPFRTWQDPLFDQFFRDFFEPRRQRVTRSSLGSGVVIDKDGYILTNQHVLLRSARITVTLVDDRDFEATLVGSDADSDLAVLRVKSDRPLPVVPMGHSDDLMIGETVIAIGNPFGLSHSVTTGVISAVGRSIRAEDQVYYDLIQTDASINPGNSGGPLLNIRGELIGINTAIYQKAQGIGFAIPIDRARRIVTDLISYGEVQLAWVGVLLQEITPQLGAALQTSSEGVLVRGLEEDSPAEKAGVRPGDIITAMDGKPVRSFAEWDSRLRDHSTGSTIRLTLQRESTNLTVDVHTRRFPDDRADALTWRLLGLRLGERNPGLRVIAVRPGSPADKVGIVPGDSVTGLAGRPTDTLDAFRHGFIALRHAQQVLLSVQRGKRVYNVPLPLAAAF
jgi:serine protease Do